MDSRTTIQSLPLHLTSLAIISPTNGPLFVHSFTGKSDELRHYHLAHAAIDVIEERIVMTSTPTKPADSYLGLLFCMEDMAFYGFQSNTKLRIVLSVALVDAMIKDSDIVAIFRAVLHLLLTVSHNPFLSLPSSFRARTAAQAGHQERKIINPSIPTAKMFGFAPGELQPEWFGDSVRFQAGIERIGRLLTGGRA
ncbi:MAG: hypothetical protein TREMPRED_002741 [Tremellales sp. Tagirdzhanova-0007]|nr:MAG: hypothetical protein TREMPRED_002741 [Tremellales sp. Tagirdzhanova-0007]